MHILPGLDGRAAGWRIRCQQKLGRRLALWCRNSHGARLHLHFSTCDDSPPMTALLHRKSKATLIGDPESADRVHIEYTTSNDPGLGLRRRGLREPGCY